MKNRQAMNGIIALICFLVLILDSQTAFSGASKGLDCCMRTLIPSLFPLLLISNLILTSLSGTALPFLHTFGKKLQIPQSAEYVLLPAIFGGYPAGAQAVSACYEAGHISRQTAERMLPFCNISGPSFIFGIVAGLFPHKITAWMIWIIQLFSAYLVSRVLAPQADIADLTPVARDSNWGSMTKCIITMAKICGWVMIFRIIIEFFDHWFLWLAPLFIKQVITGLLELSSGCLMLNRIESVQYRFILANLFLSFGGICVTMQTASVIHNLSMKKYFIGKLLQVLYGGILSFIYILNPIIFGTAILLIMLFPAAKQKSCSISGVPSV